MTIRSASFLAAAALAALSAPAIAQDDYHPGPPPPLPDFDAGWDATWEEYPEEIYRSEDEVRYANQGLHQEPELRWRDERRPTLGYSDEQRSRWIAQCRAAYDEASGSRRGAIVGGLLGAVAGGVAGNRIADGERLGGTLIGAGVGGLAGAAIGGAIGAESDRERAERRFDACEDYLLRYEQSIGYGPSHGPYGYGYPPAPVVWVKVPIVTKPRGDCDCKTIVEERIVEQPAPAPRAKPVKIRRIAPDKRLPASK